MTNRILIVDDDDDLREALAGMLQDLGYETRAGRDAETALGLLEWEDFDVAVVDLRLPNVDGVELCKRIAGNHPTLRVVFITAYGNVQAVVAAMQAGAHDFITKPCSGTELGQAVARALKLGTPLPETRRIDEPSARHGDYGLVGSSTCMEGVREKIKRFGPTECTVLVTGESGTGKELVARALHRASPRHDGPFVPINCAAMPEALLESELFGHTKGAFTGAETNTDGLFVVANGGTLFLDEIGAMPLKLQPKLLRALQDPSVRAVGGTRERSVDVRVVAATNGDLSRAVQDGTFRRDLYFRLDVASIHLPPLRDRADDVVPLVQHFLETSAGGAPRRLTPEALRHLRSYPWPGNVRELENCVRASVALAMDGAIEASHLPARIRMGRPSRAFPPGSGEFALAHVERAHIDSVLRALDGNKAKAAETLGIDRSTLYRKLKRYGLDRDWV